MKRIMKISSFCSCSGIKSNFTIFSKNDQFLAYVVVEVKEECNVEEEEG